MHTINHVQIRHDAFTNCYVLGHRLYCLQGDTSEWKKTSRWLSLTVPAAHRPLLQPHTALAGWGNIQNLSQREVFTILMCHPYMPLALTSKQLLINYSIGFFWYFKLIQYALGHVLSLDVVGDPLHRSLPAHEADDGHRLRAGDQPDHGHVAQRAWKTHQVARCGYKILK